MLRKIQIAESAKSHKHAKLIAEASQTLEDAVAAADLQLLGPVLEGVWRERDPLRHTHTHTNTTARSHAPSLLSPPSFHAGVTSVSQIQSRVEGDAAALNRKSERLLSLASGWKGALDNFTAEVRATGAPQAWGSAVASDLDSAAADLERAGQSLSSDF